jgi:hypothetical protein
LVILLLVRDALHRCPNPHIGGSIALLGCLIPLLFDTLALVVSYVAPLLDEIAFVTGLVTFKIGPVALIRCGQSARVATNHAFKVPAAHDAPPDR